MKQRRAYNFRRLDKVRVKGKIEPVSIFEVFDGETETVVEVKRRTKPDFEEGVSLYYDKRFAEASEKFHDVLEQNPEDKTVQIYLQRAAHFIAHGVPPDWNGVEELTEK